MRFLPTQNISTLKRFSNKIHELWKVKYRKKDTTNIKVMRNNATSKLFNMQVSQ